MYFLGLIWSWILSFFMVKINLNTLCDLLLHFWKWCVFHIFLNSPSYFLGLKYTSLLVGPWNSCSLLKYQILSYSVKIFNFLFSHFILYPFHHQHYYIIIHACFLLPFFVNCVLKGSCVSITFQYPIFIQVYFLM